FEHGLLYERVIIYISPEFLQQQSTPDCQLEEIFNGEHGHVLHMNHPETLWQISDALEQELSKDDYGRVILSNGLLLRLLIEIARSIRDPKTKFSTPIIPADSRILDILRYMDAHLAEDLSIDTLAEEFFISKFHMMRLFKQETGRSIYDYLQERRLLHARDLIRQGVSATDSCFQSGFRSYSSFTRAFAKHFGTTPTGRKGSSAPADETYE
ncbi:MAG: helix-turn-helix transcriptional regulator, partial [Anaerotignum sp.]|nr:helix-turn-helix transcriptional regulator [Anaerotignum sp.]